VATINAFKKLKLDGTKSHLFDPRTPNLDFLQAIDRYHPEISK